MPRRTNIKAVHEKKHKAKLADQDLRLMKYKQHVEVFNDLHKDCKVGVALGDFNSDPAELEPSDKEKKQMAQSIVTVNGLEEKCKGAKDWTLQNGEIASLWREPGQKVNWMSEAGTSPPALQFHSE